MPGDPDRPTVSIVITTYYRNGRLRDAIESVLGQTYDSIELVVVDGAVDGHARSVVESYGGRYLAQDEHLTGITGPAAGRDIGVAHATGAYVHFLDDDDRLHEDAIAKQVAAIEASEEIGFVYCGLEWEGGDRIHPSPVVRGDALKQALTLEMAPCVPSTMLIDADLLRDVPPMRDLPHDDAALKIELARRTRIDYVDEVLVFRGDSEGSLTATESSVMGRRRTIERYDDLYDRFEPSVRRTALARTHYQEGQYRIVNEGWSIAAIRAFLAANYHTPRPQAFFIGGLVTALFGRRGYSVGGSLYRIVSSGKRYGNAGQQRP